MYVCILFDSYNFSICIIHVHLIYVTEAKLNDNVRGKKKKKSKATVLFATNMSRAS